MSAFFFEQTPVSAQGLAEKEAQSKPQYPETAFGHIMAVPLQQIVVDLLLGQFLRATPMIANELFDRSKIGASRCRRQTGHFHILEELNLERVALGGYR